MFVSRIMLRNGDNCRRWGKLVALFSKLNTELKKKLVQITSTTLGSPSLFNHVDKARVCCIAAAARPQQLLIAVCCSSSTLAATERMSCNRYYWSCLSCLYARCVHTIHNKSIGVLVFMVVNVCWRWDDETETECARTIADANYDAGFWLCARKHERARVRSLAQCGMVFSAHGGGLLSLWRRNVGDCVLVVLAVLCLCVCVCCVCHRRWYCRCRHRLQTDGVSGVSGLASVLLYVFYGYIRLCGRNFGDHPIAETMRSCSILLWVYILWFAGTHIAMCPQTNTYTHTKWTHREIYTAQCHRGVDHCILMYSIYTDKSMPLRISSKRISPNLGAASPRSLDGYV